MARPDPLGALERFRFGDQTITVPDGFHVERAAGPPLVDRPIVAALDERGRLLVAESSGTNDPVQKQLAERPHRVLRLEDVDGDGQYDRRTVFADRLMFPEGALWHDGSLYVAAPPSIWRLTDEDDDGVADRREEWFEGKTLTGCANDLHGPYLGRDGWIYWCKGAFAEQRHELTDGSTLVTRAAHIFRRRPGGGAVESVMTGGMDNPVDVVFTLAGERLFTTTFIQHPAGGRRDAVVHAVYGGVYGKRHGVIDGHPRTGGLMPVMTHLGAAAACGLELYESRVLGDDFEGNLFACLFNMRRVTRHVLEPDGATFRTRDEDFVVSDSTDFHPTDVLEDADGSLLVIDTGGWYKLCCPTSQLWKPDVLGAIYRVRRVDAAEPVDPRGERIAWTRLSAPEAAALLDDSRPAVRRRAIEALARATDASALGALEGSLGEHRSPVARVNAVWALTRRAGAEARQSVRGALRDSDATVRGAAAHSAGLWRDASAAPALIELLEDARPAVRRCAAEALGRIGATAAVPPLLATSAAIDDRVLEHSLIYALIEIGDPEATAAGLDSPHAGTRRAAAIALDQMRGGRLQPVDVLSWLDGADTTLRRTALWIAGRHPEWSDEIAALLRRRVGREVDGGVGGAEWRQLLGQLASRPGVRELLAATLEESSSSPARLAGLDAMGRARGEKAPPGWIPGLARAVAADDATVSARGIATAARLKFEGDAAELSGALRAVAADDERPTAIRVQALAAIPDRPVELDDPLVDLLRENLSPDAPAVVRAEAASVLGRTRLEREQLATLVDVVAGAGPLEVPRLLPAFERCDESVGAALITALGSSPGAAALQRDILVKFLETLPSALADRGKELVASLDAGGAENRARLEEIEQSLPEGDVRRGQAVFNGTKGACSACHEIGYLGGSVGPDLTRIGKIRTARDLLESIVFPSASFVRSYEPVLVITRDGQFHNGTVRDDRADALVLATGPTEQVTVPRDDIREIKPSTVSVMPSGLDQQLTPQELADLVAFLLACR